MFIQNISREDCKIGRHFDCGNNSMLIQIRDPDNASSFSENNEFPVPYHKFKAIHKFEFFDCDNADHPIYGKFSCTDEQGEELVKALQYALDNRMSTIVHCHAGICRSGAVVEVGIIMGFQDGERMRIPNVLVKSKMMKALGVAYDSSEELKKRWEESERDRLEGKSYF